MRLAGGKPATACEGLQEQSDVQTILINNPDVQSAPLSPPTPQCSLCNLQLHRNGANESTKEREMEQAIAFVNETGRSLLGSERTPTAVFLPWSACIPTSGSLSAHGKGVIAASLTWLKSCRGVADCACAGQALKHERGGAEELGGEGPQQLPKEAPTVQCVDYQGAHSQLNSNKQQRR